MHAEKGDIVGGEVLPFQGEKISCLFPLASSWRALSFAVALGRSHAGCQSLSEALSTVRSKECAKAAQHLDIGALHAASICDGVAERIGQGNKDAHVPAELDGGQPGPEEPAGARGDLPGGHLGQERAARYGPAACQHRKLVRTRAGDCVRRLQDEMLHQRDGRWNLLW